MPEHSAYSKENFHKVVAESNAARRPKSNQSFPASSSSGAPPLKRQKKQARFDGKTPDHYLFDSEEYERGSKHEVQATDSSSDNESSKVNVTHVDQTNKPRFCRFVQLGIKSRPYCSSKLQLTYMSWRTPRIHRTSIKYTLVPTSTTLSLQVLTC